MLTKIRMLIPYISEWPCGKYRTTGCSLHVPNAARHSDSERFRSAGGTGQNSSFGGEFGMRQIDDHQSPGEVLRRQKWSDCRFPICSLRYLLSFCVFINFLLT